MLRHGSNGLDAFVWPPLTDIVERGCAYLNYAMLYVRSMRRVTQVFFFQIFLGLQLQVENGLFAFENVFVGA